MNQRLGFRGYIASRPVRGNTTPQRVQNLVIRDYCARRGTRYLVSLTEYAMPGCYMMLENVLQELPKIEGIVCFSAFMLPPQRDRRRQIYARIFEAGASLHAALENIALISAADVERFEDLLSVAFLLDRVPLAGRYEKTDRALRDAGDSFTRTLASAINP
ncbi:MAG: LIC12192 family sporadic carbohydrate cluster protein [Polyangiaceae bacterium]